MHRIIIFLLAITLHTALAAQKIPYSSSNAHSHNNYAQPIIFWEAYNLQYGSIEADIFLSADSTNLWVAHSREELANKKLSLDSLYLQPLVNCIRKNNGFVYADHFLKLQLMIDIKSAAEATLQQLVKMIMAHPELINNTSLKIVISGNRPDPAAFLHYPSFIWFDGELGKNYSKASLEKIAMMSAPLTKYTHWNGTTAIAAAEQQTVETIIKQVHDLKKTIRFWDAPDSPRAWTQLMQWQVDFINTDHVAELAQYLADHRQ
jgi:alkaline phosphatase